VIKRNPKPAVDHSEMRAIYNHYVTRTRELEPHRAYCRKVVQATAGAGKTPVEPLATMGTGGGPLLCDWCGKPIPLEGGLWHGKTADSAWTMNPQPGWVSYILGGLMVETASNGTLRIYHGYDYNPKACCSLALADWKHLARQFKWERPPDFLCRMYKFLKDEYPSTTEQERCGTISAILNLFSERDPGIGLNRPG
jgi:hypothetical protein